MRKDKYSLYGVDNEKKVYRKIGKDYSEALSKNQSRKLKRRKYTICNTYSEWEKHIKRNLPIEIINYDDFLHWTERNLRRSENYVEAVKCILIPIYITLASLAEIFLQSIDSSIRLYFIVIFLAIIAGSSGYGLNRKIEEINFWKDYIKIAQTYKTNGQ